MRYLIDTQILIWYQLSSDKLSKNSIDLLLDLKNEIFVSQITLFELTIKHKDWKATRVRYTNKAGYWIN